MKIAIDLDGTAFAWPLEFRDLILTLIRGGAKVVLLTAAAGELPPEQRPKEVARRVSERLLFHDVPIVCCGSHEKGEWMTRNRFDMIIDDNSPPGWRGLHLMPKRNP